MHEVSTSESGGFSDPFARNTPAQSSLSSGDKVELSQQIVEELKSGNLRRNRVGLPSSKTPSPPPPPPPPPPTTTTSIVVAEQQPPSSQRPPVITLAGAPSEAGPSHPRPLPLEAAFDEMAHQLMIKFQSRYQQQQIAPGSWQPSTPPTLNRPPRLTAPTAATPRTPPPPGAAANRIAIEALANRGDRLGNPIPLSKFHSTSDVDQVAVADAAAAREIPLIIVSDSPPKSSEVIDISHSPTPGPSGLQHSATSCSDDKSSLPATASPPVKKSKGSFSLTLKSKTKNLFKKGRDGKTSSRQASPSSPPSPPPPPPPPPPPYPLLSNGARYFSSNPQTGLIIVRLLTSMPMVKLFRRFRINIVPLSKRQLYPDHIAALISWLSSGNWQHYREFTAHPSTVGFSPIFFSWLHHLRHEIGEMQRKHILAYAVYQFTSLEEYMARIRRRPSSPQSVYAQCPFSNDDKSLYAVRSGGFIRSIPFFDDNYISQRVLTLMTNYFVGLRHVSLPAVYVPYVTPISTELACIVSFISYGGHWDLLTAIKGSKRNMQCEPAHAEPSFFSWVLYLREIVLHHERRVALGQVTADSLFLPNINFLRHAATVVAEDGQKEKK